MSAGPNRILQQQLSQTSTFLPPPQRTLEQNPEAVSRGCSGPAAQRQSTRLRGRAVQTFILKNYGLKRGTAGVALTLSANSI